MDFNKLIDNMSEEMIANLQNLLRIPSVGMPGEGGLPFGIGTEKCLEFCLKLSQEMGFTATNVDHMLGYCEYGEGSEMIAVLGHLDIVPEGDGWTYPPYEAVLKGNRLYGRGAIDNKGPLMAALYALKAVRDSGVPLSKRVRIFFGINEETGSADMKYYLSKGGEIPVMGFTPDGEYPVINGEKGIVNAKYVKKISQTGSVVLRQISGGLACNVVPDHAYAILDCTPEKTQEILRKKIETATLTPIFGGIKIETLGVSAHGSTPEKGSNAIGLLVSVLNEIELCGETKELIEFLNDYIGMESDGKSLGISAKDNVSGKLTFNLGCISGDAHQVQIEVNLRYPVTYTYEQCMPILEEKLKTAGFIELNLIHKNSLYMSPDSRLVKTLCQVYEEQTGEKAFLKSIGGGTYAKAIPNIVAFGPIFPGDDICEHKPDEYIEISKLTKNANIMAHAIYELAK